VESDYLFAPTNNQCRRHASRLVVLEPLALFTRMENMLYPDKNAAVFEELQLNCLTVKNRLFRSSISGRIDNYNGSGTSG